MTSTGVGDGCLGGGQAGDWNTEGGAGHVVQSDIVAEHDGGGIAAVLTANAQVYAGIGGAAPPAGVGNQAAHAVLVQTGEGIALIDFFLVVGV